jgi:hypothetical protein
VAVSKLIVSLNQPMSLPKYKAHVIATVTYAPGSTDYDAAPTECTCGWSGTAGEYSRHRLESGARKAQYPLTRVFANKP